MEIILYHLNVKKSLRIKLQKKHECMKLVDHREKLLGHFNIVTHL